MTNKSLMLFFLLFGFTLSLSAQKQNWEGYVITVSLDTLFGTVKHKSKDELKEKIHFRASDTLKRFYRYDEMVEFMSGDERYIIGTLDEDGEKVPLRVISEGRIRLYEHQNLIQQGGNYKVRYDLYAFNTKDSVYTPLRNMGWKKQLEEIFTESTELVEFIRNGKHKMEDLKDLFDRFNRWYREQTEPELSE
jgi:hypothetical protein